MHTQIGIFAKHLSRSTPEELFEAVAGYGFNCVQFNAACLGVPSLPDTLDQALWHRTAGAARSAGVKVVALSATFNLLDENKLRLADDFRRLELLAQGATILGTDLVTLCRRPPADPRQDGYVITNALLLVGDRVAIAHCKDVADPIAKQAAQHDHKGLYEHVAAGTGILDYRHYVSELKRLVPESVPLILHGLTEEQIPASVSFMHDRINEVAKPYNA
jgi:sugar phosphate isomerase/epimerase